jgi:sulfur carrier protein
MSKQTVRVVVNGQPHELPRPLAIAEMLSQLGIAPRGIAVEVNMQVVPRSRHAEHVLRDGDRLEIVSLVGGG